MTRSRVHAVLGCLLLNAILVLPIQADEAGYRIYQQSVPRGAAPPTDRSLDSGWVLVPPGVNGYCVIAGDSCFSDAGCVALGDSRDKCAVPVSLQATVTVSCAEDVDFYLATTLVFDSGMETPVVSANSEVVHCFECEGTDNDGDSFCVESSADPTPDCDDTNPAVHPNAPEVCDGVNNDCNHPEWPGLTGTDEVDADGDGFGECGDCDDSASDIFPGAAQLCDGVNTDCSDPTWPQVPDSELDGDGDNYAPCEGDCDDDNPGVYPDAPETINGIDDDCDGQIDEELIAVVGGMVEDPEPLPLGGPSPLGPGGSPVEEPAAWSAFGSESGEDFGSSVAFAGDVNGDGFDDVVVGSRDFQNGDGKASVFYGSSDGLVQSAIPIVGTGGENFGTAVASAGDVNGDGYSDVIVGAPRHDIGGGAADAGRARLYLGSESGISTTPAWTKVGVGTNELFGTSVASAGDVNKDGYHDVLVGAPSPGGVGHVDLFLGRPGSIPLFETPVWSFSGQANGHLGFAVASAGDTDNNGYVDIIVGEPFYQNGQINEGRASVFLNTKSAPWFPSTPDWTKEGDQTLAQLGEALASAGDVDGDEYDDVIVGAFSTSGFTGAAYVYSGTTDGPATTPSWSDQGEHSFSQFGAAVSGAGDVNADGFDDVLVGAPFYAETENLGKVYLYLGSVSGLSADPDWDTKGSAASQLGFAVALMGDVNGDCASDVLIGAPFDSTIGQAILFEGLEKDTDSDGLCDAWEWRGVDIDYDFVVDLDLPTLGANKNQPDLFVEVDAMVGRVPPADSMTMLVSAFADRGVTLHLEESAGNTGVDDVDVDPAMWCNECDFDPFRPLCPQGYARQFVNAKEENFGTAAQRANELRWRVIRRAKNRTYHYCVSIDRFGGDGSPNGPPELYWANGSAGEGELPGNDCIVALGAEWDGRPLDDRGKASAFMHELGHNLGLRHGGDNDTLRKPNYHSIMNYVWTFPDPDYEAHWNLDYSDTVFSSVLDETALVENDGIEGHSGLGHELKVGGPNGVHLVDEFGPVDWNDNRTIDAGTVQADIDKWFGTQQPGPPSHTGFDDWANIDFTMGGTLAFQDGVYECLGGELRYNEWRDQLGGYTDCNNNGTADRDDVGACTSADCNGDGVPDDCQIAAGTKEDDVPPGGNGIPDECECVVSPPATTPKLTVHRGYLSWNGAPSSLFDTVWGDLGILLASGGDFTQAIQGCTFNDLGLTSVVDNSTPASGELWFFIGREANCAGNGSLDSGGPSQAGSRDAEINASSATCPPYDCGNGIQEAGETCDRWDLGCQTCQDQGFTSGSLRCNLTCDGYDVSGCQ